ncbi:MAG: CpsD/CapB family tyrosine-protein kinase [Candidatus Omnitrophica bacterium]|nr:CpsD/CapB family tyrosine-protein kinase [Candidatus Omnitrophota bacterium]
MSKFTKALEKIQEGKVEAEESLRKQPFSFETMDAEESKQTEWKRGIPSIKNARPLPDIVSYHFSDSVMAEQYRMLRANLETSFTKEGGKVILVSSSVHGEGKTVTTANLALTLAENPDIRIAVIDADLRKGRLAECLGFGKDRTGLSNYLTNGEDFSPKKFMVKNSKDNIVVIPRGAYTKNPSQLVNSGKFRMLIAQLRNWFDYVLIDSPPIMAVADASIIGREADGLLMIIRLGKTPKNIISHANLLFKQAGINLLGYVLTNVAYPSEQYRYYYGYSDVEEKQVKRFKRQAKSAVRKVGAQLQNFEEQFNTWWDHKVAAGAKQKREKIKSSSEVKES